MKNIRIYGRTPYSVAVIHGGPGARGDMAPVAKELSKICGVLEPLQTVASINGQVKELHLILKRHSKLPVILIGHSWGAWLSYVFAFRYPRFVRKLILVGSGPFEEKYVSRIMKSRQSHLNKEEKAELNNCIEVINNPIVKDRDVALEKFGNLMSKTDSYKPILTKTPVEVRYDIFQKVWQEAEELRRSGKLLRLAKQVKCPVIAIRGDYDPHPYVGVIRPLSRTISGFQSILLKKCGHYPWLEYYAQDKFYKILKKELT